MAGITTICIVGFPPDATPRELKNLCRFSSGFEDAHVAFAGGQGQASALFVKFKSPEHARLAIEVVHNAPFDQDAPLNSLRAEFARREMEVRPASLPQPMPRSGVPAPTQVASLPPWQLERAVSRAPTASPAYAGHHGGGAAAPVHFDGGGLGPHKRPPSGPGGEPLCTMTILGLKSKGLSVHELEKWCLQRSGFVAMQVNERIDGVFCRFSTSHEAELAIQDSNALNWGAEWARRNLDDDIGMRGGLAAAPPPPLAAPVPQYGGGLGGGYGGAPPKRPRTAGGDLDTITVLGLTEKGLAHGDVQQWFQQRPGFIALQVNERIDALFIKFACNSDADQAMRDANSMQFGAEWARRNLDL